MRALVVHGGAGAAPAAGTTGPARVCEEALARGWDVLARGGSATDAVVACVTHLENDPTMNAGYGACLTDAGTVELDASIMEGTTRRAGAVAVVRRLANPILVARSLMDEGPHVLMAGEHAETLAAERGFPLVEPAALISPARRTGTPTSDGSTVGAVALDARGGLAAATSTGGIAGQRRGRIGDSAIIGAGTFADDRAGAASATGDGEAIMRAALARMTVEGLARALDPARAAARALAEVSAVGGAAGVIVVDRLGRVAGVHTTPHMIWATRRD